MGYRTAKRPWPMIVIYYRCEGGKLLAASLFHHTKWAVTEVRVPRSMDGLHTVLEARRSGEGFRVAIPDPPSPAGQLVLTRNKNRGVWVEGSRSPGTASRCADLILDALSRHEKTTELKQAEAARAREAERKRLAEAARANPRKVDDRDRSVSLRTVSGGLPILGRRSR